MVGALPLRWDIAAAAHSHIEVFRKPGTTRFLAIVYDLLPIGEWWDTIPADADRCGARKFSHRAKRE